MKQSQAMQETLKRGSGILRMIPNFVPRRFARPGRRLRLHPDDYFALGTARGAIKERWFASTITAMNGPAAPHDEGLSYVCAMVGKVNAVGDHDDVSERFTLRDMVSELGDTLIGSLQQSHGEWPMYSKFFDYQTPLFHHLHLTDEAAARVGRRGKPEAYYFPPQLNNHLGDFPVTYFGFDPDTTIDQVRERLACYESGDNRITELSRAFRIELGTGWYTSPGVVHAPGSVLTYEPQLNSDVNSVYENVASDEVYPYEFLIENCPPARQRDVDYVLGLMDWDKNIDPNYKAQYFRPPLACRNSNEQFTEQWIVYGNEYFAAKELTVKPGEQVKVADQAAYGCILVQGYGKVGEHHAETAIMLRYGQGSADEFFVSESAARQGVVITNHSQHEPLVMLKHFGPNMVSPSNAAMLDD